MRLSPIFEWRKALVAPEFPCSSKAQHVALVLSLHMDSNGGSCYPAVPTIAREARRSRSTVTAALKEVEDAGYLGIERPPSKGPGSGRGHSSRYFIKLPESLRSPSASAEKPPDSDHKPPESDKKPPETGEKALGVDAQGFKPLGCPQGGPEGGAAGADKPRAAAATDGRLGPAIQTDCMACGRDRPCFDYGESLGILCLECRTTDRHKPTELFTGPPCGGIGCARYVPVRAYGPGIGVRCDDCARHEGRIEAT